MESSPESGNVNTPHEILWHLEKYRPDLTEEAPELDEFAFIVSTRLKEQMVTPLGFIMLCSVELDAIEKSVNPMTGMPKPYPAVLSNESPEFYARLQSMIPVLAEAAYPEGFAAEVRQYFEEISSE